MPVVVATGHPLVPTIEYCMLTKPRGMLKYFVKLDTALAMALDLSDSATILGIMASTAS